MAAGLSNGHDVSILHSILADFDSTADVYVHEKVHHNTNAPGAASGYRNYPTLALSQLVLEKLKNNTPKFSEGEGI